MNVLDKLVFNLQTIATISKGKRIGTVKEFIIIEDDSPVQGFWRWKNAESRDKAVSIICREVRTTIAFAEYILEIMSILTLLPVADEGQASGERLRVIEHTQELKKIQEALVGAAVGINNISQTYYTDADVSGHLQPLITEMHGCGLRITTAVLRVSGWGYQSGMVPRQ